MCANLFLPPLFFHSSPSTSPLRLARPLPARATLAAMGGSCAVQPASNASLALTAVAMRFMRGTSRTASDANRACFAAAMGRAFALLATPDAVAAGLAAFVLDTDPQTDVALLSNPDFLAHATTVSIANSEIEVDGGHEGLFDSELTIDFMLIPCRVQGALSYGCVGRRVFGVAVSCGKAGAKMRRHDLAMGRYVRNEATGELLMVASSYHDDYGAECITIVHTQFEGTTRQSSMRAVFNPAEFADPATGPVRAVRRAVNAAFTRFCPVCRKSPHAKCECEIPYDVPAGPNDLAAVARNSRHTMGDWMGTSTNTVHCPTFHTYGAVHVMTRRSTHAPLASAPYALHQRILQARLSLASPARAVIPYMYDPLLLPPSNAPPHAPQPPQPQLEESRSLLADGDVADDTSSLATPSASIAALLCSLTPLPPQPPGAGEINRVAAADIPAELPECVLDNSGGDSGPLGDADAAIDTCVGAAADGDCGVFATPLPSTAGMMSVDGDILNELYQTLDASCLAPPASSPVTNQEQPQSARPPQPPPLPPPPPPTQEQRSVSGAAAGELNDPAGLMMTALLSANPELAAISGRGAGSSGTPEALPVAAVTSMASATSLRGALPSVATTTSVVAYGRAAVQEGAPHASPSRASSPCKSSPRGRLSLKGKLRKRPARGAPVEARDAEEEIREEEGAEAGETDARLVSRVEKNRAAARVSNARRKDRNLNLRRDLSFFRSRLTELRDREKRLRDENRKLKASKPS